MGFKSALFIDENDLLLCHIVNAAKFQRYVSNDTLSNVTDYLEAKLGRSSSVYYTTDEMLH